MGDSDAHASFAFLRNFVGSAQRLAEHGIVVLRLRADWASVGSWVLEAQRTGRHGVVVRAAWDGRDGELELVPGTEGPPAYLPFDSSQAALEHVEGLLIEGLGE